MKLFVRLIGALCTWNLLVGIAFGATLTVPTEYPTIQSAIDASMEGDTVLLLPGTYRESIQLVEGIRLVGESADSVILANGEDWRVIRAEGIENASIENLSVRNELAGWATGLHFLDAAVDLTGIRVEGFSVGVNYRGRYDYDQRRYLPLTRIPEITESAFVANQTALSLLGAMSPVIEQNSFTDNSGSAIYLKEQCSPEILRNHFEGNGTGIYLFERCLPQVRHNEIIDNGSGMVLAWSSHATIVGNLIQHNRGDGIWSVSYSSPLISNNIVSDNGGDGLWMFLNWARIQNNTIAYNAGDGISSLWYASIRPINNLIVGNGGWGVYAGEDLSYGAYRTRPYLSYNLLFDNAAGNFGELTTLAQGNRFTDPLFRAPDQYNYELSFGSPAIDAGAPEVQWLDPDGTRNDMGAYGGPDALPSSSVDPAETATGISAQIITLPDSAFKNEPADRKASVEEKFSAVIDLLQTGNELEDAEAKSLCYTDALNKLTNDLLKKSDGHFGGNPKNDWITSYEAQSVVYPMIVDLTNELELLLAEL